MSRTKARLARLENLRTGEGVVFIRHSLLDKKFHVQGKSFSTEQKARAFVGDRAMVVSTQIPEPNPLPEGFGR